MATAEGKVIMKNLAQISEDNAQLRRLEIASIVEATTLIALLGVAVPLKHFLGWPAGSRVLGPIHGLAFIFYLWTVIQTISGGGWQRGEIMRLGLVAFIPFGGFANVRWLRRRRHPLSNFG
jgi:integral membrane protein